MSDLSNVRVNGARLWDSLMEMAKIGATPKGGCKRLTLTDLDKQGRELFQPLVRGRRLHGQGRPDGQHVRAAPGEDETLPPVMVGSHLDTQPTGGKFDGVLGVLGALEVVRSLNDLKIKTRHPIEVANWTNEEGSRFAPAMVSSGVFAGVYTKEFAYSRADPEGKTLGDELERIGFKGEEPVGGRPVHAFFELHIEQGPILEDENDRRRRRHPRPGPALVRDSPDRLREPRRLDADAARARTRCSAPRGSSSSSTRSASPRRRSASRRSGMLNPYPNSRNVIPGEVFMTCEFRHPIDATLSEMDAALKEGVEAITGKIGLTYDLKQVFYYAPGRLRSGAASRRSGARPSGSATRTATSSRAPATTPAIWRASRRPR